MNWSQGRTPDHGEKDGAIPQKRRVSSGTTDDPD